tara:strand:- start:1230 stop:1544 length:315 start_codon:yes stop_codon:yes gene_type:complete
MNIKIIKLKNQEEILCEVKSETDTECTIKNPCILVPTQKQSIAMAPWLPFAKIDDGLSIPKEHILFVVDVMEEIKMQYEQQFNPIVTPSKKSIIAPSGPIGLAT